MNTQKVEAITDIQRGDLLVFRNGKVRPAVREEMFETMVSPVVALENYEK